MDSHLDVDGSKGLKVTVLRLGALRTTSLSFPVQDTAKPSTIGQRLYNKDGMTHGLR